MPPTTQYAQCGDIQVAYQVIGDGPLDIVVAPSFVSNLDFQWTHPGVKAWLDRLAKFSRLVLFDKAGTGLSDPVTGVRTLEERASEIEAVMDAAGVGRAVLFGLSEGGPMAIFFAATRRERVHSLVLFGTFPFALVPSSALGKESSDILEALPASGPDLTDRGIPTQYHPTEPQLERMREFAENVFHHWGEGRALKILVPNQGDIQQLAMLERLSASPGMARATVESAARLDVSKLLPAICVPTLVVHARDDLVPIQLGRFIADRVPGARMLEVPGYDHAPWLSDPDAIAAEVEEFVTGARHGPEPDRALKTVLFTDIVSSTERAAELGDARWRAVLERHDELTRGEIGRVGGTAVKGTGDGMLATFDGPARAIRCAESIRDSVRALGVQIRAGIHTGECELIGDDVGGMAVHIAARINALAGTGEILVSRTVRDLVVGSGIAFEDRGVRELKGVPGEWGVMALLSKEAASKSPEAELARMKTPGPRDMMRPSDRAVASLARHAPGLMHAAMRLKLRRARRAQG